MKDWIFVVFVMVLGACFSGIIALALVGQTSKDPHDWKVSFENERVVCHQRHPEVYCYSKDTGALLCYERGGDVRWCTRGGGS